MLTDDVNTTRRGNNPARLTAILFNEFPDCVVGEFFQGHIWYNISGNITYKNVAGKG
jgi:hypothetical protein